MNNEIKKNSTINVALEDLVRPLVGRVVTLTIDGQDYRGEIQPFDGIHTAPVKITEVPKP